MKLLKVEWLFITTNILHLASYWIKKGREATWQVVYILHLASYWKRKEGKVLGGLFISANILLPILYGKKGREGTEFEL